MPKKTVKRCIRPQCMEIFDETEKIRFCICGAPLQVTEIEIMPKKNPYKNSEKTSKPKPSCEPKSEEKRSLSGEENEVVEDDTKKKINNFTETSVDKKAKNGMVVIETRSEELFNFFDVAEEDVQAEEDNEENITSNRAFLYLLLEDEDIEFVLSNVTKIGRAMDGVHVDIDLYEYAGNEVSREHAVIRREKDGYYITNVSRNHSVRVMNQDDKEIALEYGKKVLLKNGDGIILSKKILLQFEEED